MRQHCPTIFTGDADSGPPVLRRPGSQESSDQSSTTPKATQQTQTTAPAQAAPAAQTSSQPPSAGTSTTTSDTSSGRPTLRRPGDEPASTPPATLQPVNKQAQSIDDNDPDRPVLRKPAAPAASDTTATQHAKAPSPDENDPNRPVLTRGNQPQTPQPKPSVAASKMSTPAAKPNAKDASTRSLAAISDANKFETRPLIYTTTPERQQELAQTMASLALADIRTFADKHTPGPKVPKNAALKDYDLRLFDLDFSNSPTLVFTAKLPVPAAGSKPFLYYVTYVAHLDINGEPAKVLSSVTDTTHLDVFPRLELIDALDADANGRGDLLFREYSDSGISYGLYRVFPYNMEKVFEGGGAL